MSVKILYRNRKVDLKLPLNSIRDGRLGGAAKFSVELLVFSLYAQYFMERI